MDTQQVLTIQISFIEEQLRQMTTHLQQLKVQLQTLTTPSDAGEENSTSEPSQPHTPVIEPEAPLIRQLEMDDEMEVELPSTPFKSSETHPALMTRPPGSIKPATRPSPITNEWVQEVVSRAGNPLLKDSEYKMLISLGTKQLSAAAISGLTGYAVGTVYKNMKHLQSLGLTLHSRGWCAKSGGTRNIWFVREDKLRDIDIPNIRHRDRLRDWKNYSEQCEKVGNTPLSWIEWTTKNYPHDPGLKGYYKEDENTVHRARMDERRAAWEHYKESCKVTGSAPTNWTDWVLANYPA